MLLVSLCCPLSPVLGMQWPSRTSYALSSVRDGSEDAILLLDKAFTPSSYLFSVYVRLSVCRV